MSIDDRKQRVLEAIVSLYALEGEPIGSGVLASYFDMAVSSATLRNEMAALTKLGLLEQPHTSAGRVPSAKGYRYYLDNILVQHPAALSPELAADIDRAFDRLDIEPEKLAQGAARHLSELTGMAAAASTPLAADLSIAHFEVVQVGRCSAAVLAVTAAGGVRTRVARVDTGLTRSDATRLAALLNRGLAFVAPPDLTLGLHTALLAQIGPRLAPVLHSAEALLNTRPKVFLEGAQRLVRWPETQDNLAHLLEMFADEDTAARLITPPTGRVAVTMGQDMTPAVPGTCIASKRYLAGGGQTGSIAVIGPSRMAYDKLIPILDYYARKLGQCMSGQTQEENE